MRNRTKSKSNSNNRSQRPIKSQPWYTFYNIVKAKSNVNLPKPISFHEAAFLSAIDWLIIRLVIIEDALEEEAG